MELFNSIEEFISPEMLIRLSKDLKEDKSKASSVVHTTIASLLDIIIEKREKKGLELTLKGVGEANILFYASDIFTGDINPNKKRKGTRFLVFLLKNKVTSFYSIISYSSGVSEENVKKIVSKVSLLVAAFLGEKLISGVKFSNITEQLEDERNNFQLYIPVEMTDIVEKYSPKFFLAQRLWTTLF